MCAYEECRDANDDTQADVVVGGRNRCRCKGIEVRYIKTEKA